MGEHAYCDVGAVLQDLGGGHLPGRVDRPIDRADLLRAGLDHIFGKHVSFFLIEIVILFEPIIKRRNRIISEIFRFFQGLIKILNSN